MTLSLPLIVTMPRKTGPDRKWHTNLNSYRNTHYHTLNKAKKIYRDMVWDEYLKFGRNREMLNTPIKITYTIFSENNRTFDVSNICSIIDKFACDALVELNVIPDDNHKHIPIVIYQFGAVDKVNPRCEMKIEELA